MKEIHVVARSHLRLHPQFRAPETVRKIRLAREHLIPGLLVDACREIVERDLPSITCEEIIALGAEGTAGLIALREQRLRRSMKPPSKLLGGGDDSTTAPLQFQYSLPTKEPTEPERTASSIQEALAFEIKDMDAEYDRIYGAVEE